MNWALYLMQRPLGKHCVWALLEDAEMVCGHAAGSGDGCGYPVVWPDSCPEYPKIQPCTMEQLYRAYFGDPTDRPPPESLEEQDARIEAQDRRRERM